MSNYVWVISSSALESSIWDFASLTLFVLGLKGVLMDLVETAVLVEKVNKLPIARTKAIKLVYRPNV